jgi:hypothetical protein
MTIARIAYQELSDEQKVQVAKILKAHPHYQRFLIAERPQGVAEEEWAFLQAAVWPDWVRPPYMRPPRPDENEIVKKYHRPVWHYINLPVVPPGEKVAVPKNLPPPDLDAQGEPGHVLAAIKKSRTMLRAADMSDECKAIYLCWLLHLVGDLHQPLHCSTLVSKQFPTGDLGGNQFLVSLKEGGPAVVLHAYWDGLLFDESAGFKQIDAKAEALRRSPEFQRDKLPELKAKDVKVWADEGFELARTVAYRDGKLQGLRRGKGMDDLTKAKAPLVPADYAAAAERVAARRMVLAGYRLGDLVREALKKD